MTALQRTTLGFLVLCLVAIVTYAIGYVAYGLLEIVPDDWVWAMGMAIMLTLYLAFVRQVMKDRKAESGSTSTNRWDEEHQAAPRGLVAMRGAALRAEHESLGEGMLRLGYQGGAPSTLDMEALEHSVHNWDTKRDTPGSLAGAAIGIELADEYLEGDM